jgi:hypothetical protein
MGTVRAASADEQTKILARLHASMDWERHVTRY